ncbi:OmpA family protein [Cellulophaga sp. E16_2]|uniref:OmpA family protein n=1 Tax=Cellulophaga sp. E16_2 TaxID=2789297 RepID=UPI0021028C12|nr:OmpA family protein [Cellulophaga sp. E16_2]
MKKTLYCYLFCFFGMLTFGYAQQSKLKKAEENFNNHSYALAIKSYEELIAKGYESEVIYKNLGDANFNNANYAKAAEWYGKLFDLKSDDIGAEYYFRYAQSLKSINDYKKSDAYMKKFQKIKVSDSRAHKFAENSDYLEQIRSKTKRFTLKKISVNSKNSEFAPSIYQGNLVFASARDTGLLVNNIHKWTNAAYLNLYQADSTNEEGTFKTPEVFSKQLNSKTHESSTAFSKEGSMVYFTRNNSKNGNFVEDEAGLSRLKIYRANLENGVWGNVTELPFNRNEYSTAHPSLSADEKTLYFASDMPPSFGASDIFKVTINEDGTFGTPENLGNTVNTEARETFPFMAASGDLYFSSDGHPGLGGLDVYTVSAKTGAVSNVGVPINSKQDDFSIILDEDKLNGYFASNRTGGMGDDDIYAFSFEKIEIESEEFASKINGSIIDKITGELIPFGKVSVYDYTNNNLFEINADIEGKFSSPIEFPSKKYRFVAEVDGYNDETVYLITPMGTVDEILEELNFIIAMEKGDKSSVIGADLVEILKLKTIFFNTNSSYLNANAYPELDKVVAYMKEFPNARVEVGSHSDSRDSDRYNLWLSDRRAKSTVSYIVSMGISEDRITATGYGETLLVNKCINDAPCSEAEHALNRRSEFIVFQN